MAFNPPPGSAPVAPIGDTDVNMDEDDSSELSYSSETTTDSEASILEVNWNDVGVDFLTTQQAIDALKARRPIPRPSGGTPPPGSAPPTTHPPPRRMENNGVKEFVKWLPYWCDPDWDDEHYIVDRDGGAQEVADVPPLDKLRPALLPKDALRNPTAYAKRFCIHPDQKDGRSRLSPTLSTTRRVQLSHAQQTVSGHKDYITVDDVHTFLTTANHDPAESAENYFRNLLYFKTGNTEQVEAYLQMSDLIWQDQAYQQFLFQDTTTDDVRCLGLLLPLSSVHKSCF